MFSSNFLLGASTFHCLCKSINFHSKLKLARISKLKTIGDLWSAAGGGLAALYLRLDVLEIMLANHPYISWIEREKLWSQSGCYENPEWLHLKKSTWLLTDPVTEFSALWAISLYFPCSTHSHVPSHSPLTWFSQWSLWNVCMVLSNLRKSIY